MAGTSFGSSLTSPVTSLTPSISSVCASSGSGRASSVASLASSHCCYLRGLILLAECRQCFVQGCDRYLDLLRGEEDLVGGFEDLFVGGVVENFIAYVCKHIYGQFHRPYC